MSGLVYNNLLQEVSKVESLALSNYNSTYLIRLFLFHPELRYDSLSGSERFIVCLERTVLTGMRSLFFQHPQQSL